uniref:Alkaline phosphatase n=1 Tax=Schistocephalus solidus TaxID=70667 RepID=A0A183T436_SCHSO
LGADSVEAHFGSDGVTDSESCAGLHAQGNIAGSADLNRLFSQSTANSRLPTYLLVQNTGSVTLNGKVPHWAPALTCTCPEL